MAKVKRDNQFARLPDENEELKKDLRRAEKMLELLTDMTTHMVEKLITDNESLEDLNEHLHEAALKMVCRNAELRRKLKEQPAVVDSSLEVEIAKLKDDLRIEKDGRRGLLEQNEELKKDKNELADKYRAPNTIKDDLDGKLFHARKEIEALKEKIKDLESKAIEDQQELIAAHKEIEKLKTERNPSKRFCGDCFKEKVEICQVCNILEAENAKLKTENESFQAEAMAKRRAKDILDSVRNS